MKITPPIGIELSGFVDRAQPATGVLDDLFTRGLYIETGAEKYLWLHCDLIGLDRAHVAQLRAVLNGELGLLNRQITISATHTHSGPATIFLRHCGKIDPAYMSELNERIIETARQAIRNPEPVSLGFGATLCSLARDRRSSAQKSHIDPVLPVLGFGRLDGSFLAVVTNYAMHNVALSYNNRLISADVAGVAAEYTRQSVRGHPVTFMTCGGCGNTVPPQVSNNPVYKQTYGMAIGTALEQVLNTGLGTQPPELTTSLDTISIPLEALSLQDIMAEYDRDCRRFQSGSKWLEALTEWRDETLALSNSETIREIYTDVQVIQIGMVTWVAIGAEVFSTTASELRAHHGPLTYVISYANGNLGYLPHQAMYVEGGYEVELAYKFYANFRIALGGYEKLRSHAIEMLAEYKSPVKDDRIQKDTLN